MQSDSARREFRELGLQPKAMMNAVEVFVYLQLLDLLTTVIGIQMGLNEASPFIRWLMEIGPVAGVALSKGLALGLGAACVGLGRHRLIVWINYWFAALVVWNLTLMLHVLPQP